MEISRRRATTRGNTGMLVGITGGSDYLEVAQGYWDGQLGQQGSRVTGRISRDKIEG